MLLLWLVLDQAKVVEKLNEIIAIAQLLGMRAIAEVIVTIDMMRCKRDVPRMAYCLIDRRWAIIPAEELLRLGRTVPLRTGCSLEKMMTTRLFSSPGTLC
jgi:predicted transposase YbfD/YdcC